MDVTWTSAKPTILDRKLESNSLAECKDNQVLKTREIQLYNTVRTFAVYRMILKYK